MKHVAVQSSNVRSVGYDPKTLEMEITFTSGDTYEFQQVPQRVYKEFVTAKSIGSYFYTHIKPIYAAKKKHG